MDVGPSPQVSVKPDEQAGGQPIAARGADAPALTVDARGVSLSFHTRDGEVQALANVDLQISDGDFVSFIGPSGCGKTTLLRVIADLERPTQGTILVNGVTPEQARLRRQYGYIFQAPALYPWRTIERNVMLPLEIMGFDARERRARMERYLKLVNLSGFERKFPWQLSGGMQQRASIARALSFDPALLLMDEPFGALDEIVRDHLNEQLLRLVGPDRQDRGVRDPLHSRSGVSLDQDRGDVAATRTDHRRYPLRFSARPDARDPRNAGIPQNRPAGTRRPAFWPFI